MSVVGEQAKRFTGAPIAGRISAALKILGPDRIVAAEMDDAEAIGQCRAGQVEAFQHLVRRYQARALAHGRALTGNDADAADAAQEAFIDAFRLAQSLPPVP